MNAKTLSFVAKCGSWAGETAGRLFELDGGDEVERAAELLAQADIILSGLAVRAGVGTGMGSPGHLYGTRDDRVHPLVKLDVKRADPTVEHLEDEQVDDDDDDGDDDQGPRVSRRIADRRVRVCPRGRR